MRRRKTSQTVALPDLLHLEPYSSIDRRQLEEIFGMAFLGRELGTRIDQALANARVRPHGWNPDLFAADLFVKSLIELSFTLEFDGREFPVNREFIYRSLVNAPTDSQTIAFRQAILRELEENEEIRSSTYRLYRQLFDLMSLLKTPGYGATLDPAAFHLDVLSQAKGVIDLMHDAFGESVSGLSRLHQAAKQTQSSDAYKTLADLLEYESGMAQMTLDVQIAGDGRIRRFAIRDLEEKKDNPFHKRPILRLFDRLRLAYRGYAMSNRELLNRMINEVYTQLNPWLVPLVQLLGHLEVYLTARTFKQRAESHGLDVSLAEITDSGPVGFDRLFNPLLLVPTPRAGSDRVLEHQRDLPTRPRPSDPQSKVPAEPPVPCDLHPLGAEPVLLITGPNSGGKTRLLQALGLTQLLGQSGLYAPAAHCRIRLQDGLFVSLIEEEAARSTEGRLGRELLRIRSVFEDMAGRSLVILDELCSGTNPSEGVEVFSMVLRLLRQIRPTAFVTTHFLDFARTLEQEPIIPGLEFLQVEVDSDQRSTYQFVQGVADTSLAALTAQRLGVTFERLASGIAARTERLDRSRHQHSRKEQELPPEPKSPAAKREAKPGAKLAAPPRSR